MREVVVTGLGTVGSFGSGAEAFAEAWANGVVPVSLLEDAAAMGAPGELHHCARVDPAMLRRLLPSGGAVRRMSLPSKLLMAASLGALADAGQDGASFGGARAGLYFGAAFGPVSFTESLLQQILDEGPQAASPMLFPECVANAPTGQVAIHLGARGPNITFVERELNGATALVHAMRQVAMGRCDRALAGFGGEMPLVQHAALSRLRSLAPAGPGGAPPQPGPFDANRAGALAAEGATVLVLETAEDAARRGGRVRARVLAGGLAFDPSATRVGWGTGADTLAEALAAGLERGGIPLQSIEAVCSGGSGSRAGDLLQARLLHRAWQGRMLPPVLAPKGAFGEHSSAPLAAAVLALQPLQVGPLPGFREVDPACGLAPWAGRRHDGADRLLMLACAAGGGMGWALLGRP